ncbi:hypothetical protein NESM_000294100 [Novymonas esmeraldas]|uniref:Uncharacterized protein n=1 Tax=Novymonas esmeraldas TaxID=1808958 RepID=A0AAW0F9Z2_9TRYP
MEHLYNCAPTTPTPSLPPPPPHSAASQSICAAAARQETTAPQLRLTTPENRYPERCDDSFIDSSIPPRHTSACFLQSVWSAEGLQDSSSGLSRTPAKRRERRGVSGATSTPPLGRREEQRGRREAARLVPASTASVDIIGVSNADSAKLAHPYGPTEQSPSVDHRGDIASGPAGKDLQSSVWFTNQLSTTTAQSRVEPPRSVKPTPPPKPPPTEPRYTHPGYFTRPLAAPDPVATETPSTVDPLGRGEGAERQVRAGEATERQGSTSRLHGSKSDASSLSPTSRLHLTQQKPERCVHATPPSPSSTSATPRPERRSSDLHHRLAVPTPGGAFLFTPLLQHDRPPTPTAGSPNEAAPSPYPASRLGGATPAASNSIVSSCGKTKAPPTAGVFKTLLRRAEAPPWMEGNLYEAQRLECQSPVHPAHSTPLVVVPLSRRASFSPTQPSHLPPPRPPRKPSPSPPPPTSSPTLAPQKQLYPDVFPAAVPGLGSPSAPPTAGTSAAVVAPGAPPQIFLPPTVALRSSTGHFAPVLLTQPPAALVHFRGTDPHQAAMASTLLEAIHRPNTRRGRRSPGAAGIFTPGMGVSSGSETTTTSAAGSGHVTHYPPPPPPPPLPSAATFTVTRGARRAPVRLSSGSGATPTISNLSWAGRKTVVLATSTVTTTTTTTTTMITAVPGDSTEFVHSAVSNPGLSISNTTVNRHISSTEQTSASSVTLQPRAPSARLYRPSESAADAPSLLSLVDIGISVDAPSPHKGRASLNTGALEQAEATFRAPPTVTTQGRCRGQSGSGYTTSARRSPPPSLPHPVSFSDSMAKSVRERALSHMECVTQPEPDDCEDTSFYKQSLLDVANRMATGQLSPFTEGAPNEFTA